MFIFIVVTLLICSITLNVHQKVKLMRATANGSAALEAISSLANYVQNSVVSSEKIDEIKTKVNSEALKMVAQQLFVAKGVSESIKKDLKTLWAAGKAKIDKIL